MAVDMAASLKEIVAGINESSWLIMEIAKASGEQTEKIAEINASIEEVSEIVQQNSALAQESAATSEESAASSEESAATADEMRGHVETLQSLLAQFKLKRD